MSETTWKLPFGSIVHIGSGKPMRVTFTPEQEEDFYLSLKKARPVRQRLLKKQATKGKNYE